MYSFRVARRGQIPGKRKREQDSDKTEKPHRHGPGPDAPDASGLSEYARYTNTENGCGKARGALADREAPALRPSPCEGSERRAAGQQQLKDRQPKSGKNSAPGGKRLKRHRSFRIASFFGS